MSPIDQGEVLPAEFSAGAARKPGIRNLMKTARIDRAGWSVLLPAALLLAASVPASAQNAPAPGGTAPAWVKLCNSDPNSKKELCLVVQELRAETGQYIASAAIRQITGDPKRSLVISVPPGMMLQPGLRVQVDGGAPTDMKYGVCFPNACYAEQEINDAFITAMKGGNQFVITTINPQAKGVSFPMTLAGFTKAFDGAPLDAAGAKAREDDLNKALQARAEEARKKLIEQQQKEGGTAPAPQ